MEKAHKDDHKWENEFIRKSDAYALIEKHRLGYGPLAHEMAHLPPVEAEPVIHAHWRLKDDKGNGICSHCNRQDKVDPLATHCRYCGAQMDQE